eukprot:s1099_g22.t1
MQYYGMMKVCGAWLKTKLQPLVCPVQIDEMCIYDTITDSAAKQRHLHSRSETTTVCMSIAGIATRKPTH